MRVGVPTEIKKNEHRIGLTPTAVREYVAHGHAVSVQQGAGLGAGFTDADYTKAGAKIVATAAEIFANNDMIVKVKEPQKVEWEMLREDQILFTYLHLAPDPEQTKGLLASVPDPSIETRQELYQIPGLPPDVAHLGPGCPFAPRCPRARERCADERPPLAELAPGHRAACWYPVEPAL